jgi:hypothetical protein
MRTKTLLLSAAVGVAGLVAASAQTVYSVNSVGYVNSTFPVGFSMIANPLDAGTGNNTVSALLDPALFAEGTTIYKFNPSTSNYTLNVVDFGAWTLPDMTLNPGEGVFINVLSSPVTVTFVGEVPQGDLTQALPAGFSIQASQVPQEGQLDTVLGFPATDGDVVYLFDNGANGYTIHAFDFGDWSTPPVPSVGESFFVNKIAATDWTRSFSVNN